MCERSESHCMRGAVELDILYWGQGYGVIKFMLSCFNDECICIQIYIIDPTDLFSFETYLNQFYWINHFKHLPKSQNTSIVFLLFSFQYVFMTI